MRLSQILISTLRDDPADAEIPSHKLLARAGLIVKIAAGVYTFAPLMWRTVKKFAQIVREELDREGANEVMLPIIQPKELWVSSGRWDRYVNDGIMFTLKDRKGSDMCLGPTHEEVMTAYVNAQVNSYKQMPVNCYQIQDKFRDEIRPRFGLMRGREFIMMDAYSFDADQPGLDAAYQKMRNAYCRIFERCGLAYTVVQADSGAIGGAGSEEFMVIADSGEDSILFCRESGYAANVEKAVSKLPPAPAGGEPKPLQTIATPDVKTVAQLEAFFPGWVAGRMAKTVLYHVTWKAKAKVVAVMMRGDLEINEVKLTNALDALTVRLATDDEIKAATGADVGYAGPVNLPEDVPLLADEYSKAMQATFMDQGGKPVPFVMGCYGIGVSRTPAAAVEQSFDDKGIVWPPAIAPFECVVAMLDPKRDEQVALADQLYAELKAAGVDVCLDDRAMSPGAKFKDNELLGFPVQVFVGRKAAEGGVEFLVRKGMQKSECAAAEVKAKVLAALGR